MKIVVLGANGRTGKLVVREALSKGDTVTAVVRSAAKRPQFHHTGLSTAVGDCCDPVFLAKVLVGHDAVISTLGGRSPTKKATSIYWRSAEAMVDAAWASGVRKVAVTSSALLLPPNRTVDAVLAALVRNVVASASRMEQTLQKTDLDLIVARCGFLTNRNEGTYRCKRDALPDDGSSVSRLSLARFLVDVIRDTQQGTRIYGVARPAVHRSQKARPPVLGGNASN